MTGIVGSIALSKVASFVKPALPYFMVGAIVLFAYLWARHSGAEAQQAKDAKDIAAITQQRDSWVSAFHLSDDNFHAAIGIANAQQAAIAGLKKEGDERARQAAINKEQAIRANAALAEQSKALSKSAERNYSSKEPCASSGTLMSSKDL